MQQELRPDFSLPGEDKIFKEMIKLTISNSRTPLKC